MPSRNVRRKAALAIGVVVLAAALALLFLRSGRGAGGPAERASAHRAHGDPALVGKEPGAPAEGAEPASPPAEELPAPGCWTGLLELDRTLGMDGFRAVLARAIAAGDRQLVGYLQERLTQLVGNDPARAHQLLGWVETSQSPELNILIEALKRTEAVHHAGVVDRLLALATRDGADLLLRGAVLDALETQRTLSGKAIASLKAVALDDTVDSVAWIAARTLGRVMTTEFERTGEYGKYWGELLDIGERSVDPAVRVLALEMPSYADPVLDRSSIDRLGNVLRKDAERDVREMAAHRLSLTEDPQRALKIYADAFAREHDLCVRWAILRFAVRAAGEDAFPLLDRFAAADPRLRQDVADFRALYARGTRDFARIWPDKREYHDCVVEEGAPH